MNSGWVCRARVLAVEIATVCTYAFDSEKFEEARRRIGRRCMNCASENHFLRACDRDYLNHFEQFTDEFGAGSTAEVNKR